MERWSPVLSEKQTPLLALEEELVRYEQALLEDRLPDTDALARACQLFMTWSQSLEKQRAGEVNGHPLARNPQLKPLLDRLNSLVSATEVRRERLGDELQTLAAGRRGLQGYRPGPMVSRRGGFSHVG